MDGLLSPTPYLGQEVKERIATPWSKKQLFGLKKSDEWHQQVDFTAGIFRPSDKRFPWQALRKHTDYYLKKSGKRSQADTDIRLAFLIENHEAWDVAIAACAHAMSPASVRALLNVELHVTPTTYYGLETYLQSLIAANVYHPQSITDLEARWAEGLLPWATHGVGAAGKYLEGLCALMRASDLPNMNIIPDFSILARRAFKDFGSQLEGLRLRNAWVRAHNTVTWMSSLARSSPPTTTPPGKLLPEHILDAQFPIWRIWSSWKPDLHRLKLLEGLEISRRGVLPDLLSLEGPDFIGGRLATLREGLIAQYGAEKPFIRYNGLVIDVPTRTKRELKDMLERVMRLLETASTRGHGAFRLFTQLTIARPITQEGLRLLETALKLPDLFLSPISDALLEIYFDKARIDGEHIGALSILFPALEDPVAVELHEVFSCSWFIQGVEQCLLDCQNAVRLHIEKGLPWPQLAQELYEFAVLLKESTVYFPLLDAELRAQLDVLPSSDLFKTILEIYGQGLKENEIASSKLGNPLKDSIEAYCIDRLMQHGTASHTAWETVNAMVLVWKKNTRAELRTLAVCVSVHMKDAATRCKCLANIPALSDECVEGLTKSLREKSDSNSAGNCLRLTRILADASETVEIYCWRDVLYEEIQRQEGSLLEYALKHFKAPEFFQFILNLNAIFADFIVNQKMPVPDVLQSSLHLWVQQSSEYIPTITRLEELPEESSDAVRCFLKGVDGSWNAYLVSILNNLTKASERPVEKLMQTVVGQLSREGMNVPIVADLVQTLLATSEEGAEACQRILDSSPNYNGLAPEAVTEIMAAGYLQDEDFMENDTAAVRALMSFLGLEVYDAEVPKDKLAIATKYFENIEKEILEEAERLDGIKKALKDRDPTGTAVLLQQLGVHDTSPLDEELEALPIGVINAVERRGPNEIEISFPLNEFSDLQRAAMGVSTAKSMLIRLYLDYTGTMPPAFCIHLDNELHPQDWSIEHTPWLCLDWSRGPERQYCLGAGNPLSWQMSRSLHKRFTAGDVDIQAIYDFVKQKLAGLAHSCAACGIKVAVNHAKLLRAAPCSLHACIQVWKNASLDIRIPELRSDPFAVDMLLTGVYAAAMSGRMEFLPGCPIKTTHAVIGILNSLPFLSVLQTCNDISTTLRKAHKDAEQLLTWACSHFRGFISSAQGMYRVPALPAGTHQFLLASANPSLESTFSSKLPKFNPQSKILFHGTSLDRLPSILAQGLRIGSGTSLQRTGAAYGKGIYMAEEPATSMSYSPAALSWKNSGLNSMRVLFGCEVAGNGRSVSPGIHVIQDEKTVMVRYVFLFRVTAHAPTASHITPAMSSAISALRNASE